VARLVPATPTGMVKRKGCDRSVTVWANALGAVMARATIVAAPQHALMIRQRVDAFVGRGVVFIFG
jgi:hypothetical protein